MPPLDRVLPLRNRAGSAARRRTGAWVAADSTSLTPRSRSSGFAALPSTRRGGLGDGDPADAGRTVSGVEWAPPSEGRGAAAAPTGTLRGRAGRSGVRSLVVAFALAAWGLSVTVRAEAWGGKVELKRRYRQGQKMVYATKMHTLAQIQSDPPGLKDLLPPVPTEFSVQQQNTVTVQRVRPDGTADVQNHFDQFDIQSDFAESFPENLRDSARETQQELTRKVAGHALTAHYDPQGRLLGFEGADEMLGELDPALREPLRQALRLVLEHMGGNTLYPDHKVKRGEEWKQKLDAQASEEYPFKMRGESTLHYAGKARYRGVKAAIVEFHFTNVLMPSVEHLGRTSPLGQLKAHGLELEIRIDGQGQGRALLALNDGRVLQAQSTIHQTLSARLTASAGLPLPTSGPVKLEIRSDTEMKVEGSGK